MTPALWLAVALMALPAGFGLAALFHFGWCVDGWRPTYAWKLREKRRRQFLDMEHEAALEQQRAVHRARLAAIERGDGEPGRLSVVGGER